MRAERGEGGGRERAERGEGGGREGRWAGNLVLVALVVAAAGRAGGCADATAFRHGVSGSAGLRLRGGMGDLRHLLPKDDSSNDSDDVDYAALTDEGKKEYDDAVAMARWEAEYMTNYTLTDQLPYSALYEEQMQHLLREAQALKRAHRKKKIALLRENRGAKATFLDENGEVKTLIYFSNSHESIQWLYMRNLLWH